MTIKTLVLGMCAMLATGVGADEWPGHSTSGLRFHADQAAFRGSAGRTLVEFYILLDASDLQYVPEGGKFVGEVYLSATVRDSAGTEVGASSWSRRLSVAKLAAVEEGGLPYRDVTGLELPPGAYTARVTAEDLFGDRKGEISLPVDVPDFSGDRFSASDVIVTASLKPATGDSKFTKAGYEVIPNTSRRHRLGEPLSAYVELYNLAPGADDREATFVLGYSLTDTSGVKVRSNGPVRLRKPGESAAKPLRMETEGLPAGPYVLEVEAFDSGRRQHVKRRRSLELATRGGQDEEKELTEEQLRRLRHYRTIEPLASKQDLKMYEQVKSDDLARQKFLRQFWKKLDPTPATDINERLIEHLRRMRHSDDYFSGRAGQRGSETPKGRVYVQYGPPDDIERHPSATDTKPYEIWHYGRYEFVFQDRNSLGYYELVHSTYPGELNNPMWEDQTF